MTEDNRAGESNAKSRLHSAAMDLNIAKVIKRMLKGWML